MLLTHFAKSRRRTTMRSQSSWSNLSLKSLRCRYPDGSHRMHIESPLENDNLCLLKYLAAKRDYNSSWWLVSRDDLCWRVKQQKSPSTQRRRPARLAQQMPSKLIEMRTWRVIFCGFWQQDTTKSRQLRTESCRCRTWFGSMHGLEKTT